MFKVFLKYAIKYHLSLTDLYILMLFGREQYQVLCYSITFHYLYLHAEELTLESEAEGLLPFLRFNAFLLKHPVQFW